MPWVNRKTHIHNKSIKHRKQTPKTKTSRNAEEYRGIQRNTDIITTMAMKLDKCDPNPRNGQDTY
jgi:hypothetical protein